MKFWQVQVPGKLFLLGEYAILEPGNQALLLTFQRYLQATITSAPQYLIHSDLAAEPIRFIYAEGEIHWEPMPENLGFVAEALQWAFAYLASLKQSPQTFALTLNSDLHQSGAKLGLGSSAAVTVAVLAAVLAFHGHHFETHDSRLKLFKLAALAHSGSQGGGSGADLAAVIFGSVTCYRRYDNTWLKPGNLSLPQLLETPWPLLGIEKWPWPPTLGLQVGWTGQPAATLDFLEEVKYLKDKEPETWMRFLFSANAAAAAACSALAEGQITPLLQAVGQYRHLLQELQMSFPMPIETPALTALADSAEALGLVAKSSGSGGGDCGLALGDPALFPELLQSWQAKGIVPLPLALDREGLTLCEV